MQAHWLHQQAPAASPKLMNLCVIDTAYGYQKVTTLKIHCSNPCDALGYLYCLRHCMYFILFLFWDSLCILRPVEITKKCKQ